MNVCMFVKSSLILLPEFNKTCMYVLYVLVGCIPIGKSLQYFTIGCLLCFGDHEITNLTKNLMTRSVHGLLTVRSLLLTDYKTSQT